MSEALKGRFRANPYASIHNSLSLVDEDNPGTVQQDTATIPVSSANEITGIGYTDSSGVEQFMRFFREDYNDGQRTEFNVAVASGPDALRSAMLTVISQFEVDCDLIVSAAAGSYIFRHVGAGTLNNIYLDGTATPLVRGALPATVATAGATAAQKGNQRFVKMSTAKQTKKK